MNINRLMFLALLAAQPAFAGSSAVSPVELPERLSDLMKSALTEKIADAEIRIPSLEKICAQKPLNTYAEIRRVRLVEDRATGMALFEVNGIGTEGREQGDLVQTPYSAWKKVPVAKRRIYPNQRLKNEDFVLTEVNVASGSAREFRGIMLRDDTDFTGLQSKQSILENQFATSAAVERAPDLRRGDTVKLDLVSGDLTLTTQATAVEPAAIGERVRVLTIKTKKEMSGILREDHSVEVRL